VPDGIEYPYIQMYGYIQWCPVEIQTPEHWNLVGYSMTCSPPVFSPSSILLPFLSHAFLSARKNVACVKKMLLLHFFSFFLVFLKSEIA
jgi:hypothetical protein